MQEIISINTNNCQKKSKTLKEIMMKGYRTKEELKRNNPEGFAGYMVVFTNTQGIAEIFYFSQADNGHMMHMISSYVYINKYTATITSFNYN
jgi:hypothetical protein